MIKIQDIEDNKLQRNLKNNNQTPGKSWSFGLKRLHWLIKKENWQPVIDCVNKAGMIKKMMF